MDLVTNIKEITRKCIDELHSRTNKIPFQMGIQDSDICQRRKDSSEDICHAFLSVK